MTTLERVNKNFFCGEVISSNHQHPSHPCNSRKIYPSEHIFTFCRPNKIWESETLFFSLSNCCTTIKKESVTRSTNLLMSLRMLCTFSEVKNKQYFFKIKSKYIHNLVDLLLSLTRVEFGSKLQVEYTRMTRLPLQC